MSNREIQKSELAGKTKLTAEEQCPRLQHRGQQLHAERTRLHGYHP